MKKYQASPILHGLRPFLPAYGALFGVSFFTSLAILAVPMFSRQVVDRVLYSRNMYTLLNLAIITLFALIVCMILELLRKKTLERIAIVFDQRIGPQVFEALQRVPADQSVARSSAAMHDLGRLRDFLSGNYIGTVFDALWSPLYFLILWLLHPVFALIVLLLVVISTALTALNHLLVRADNKRANRAYGEAHDFALAVARSSESVRALGMVTRLRDRWLDRHKPMLGWQAAVAGRTNIIVTIVRVVDHSTRLATYSVGAIFYLNGELSTGGLFVSVMIIMRAVGPISSVVSNWRVFGDVSAAIERLDELVILKANEPVQVSLPPPQGNLVVSRVFCAAPGVDKMILNDVSFTLESGRVLGVVGPSGAGKSCLARVLVRIWSPLRGSIVIGDHELSQWSDEDLGSHIGYVPQDVDLIPGTVAENIARFDPAVEEDSSVLLAAAEIAGIQDLVRTLPQGFNTVVGAGGHVLSGGQRGRIALARAVYGNPGFVVMDEPNSNLDALGEQALVNMIEKLQSLGTTVVIVTHKLNLLQHCDDVLVLNAGSVQAFGSREQIVSRIPRLRGPALQVIEGSLDNTRSS